MATYAILNGNTVSNVIVADNKEETEAALSCVLVEYTDENPASIGWIYNGVNFVAPVVVETVLEEVIEETVEEPAEDPA
jgi:hypothetical protein